MEKVNDFIKRAENLFELGKFSRAEAVLEKGLKRFPESKPIERLKNDIHYTSKDYESVPFKYQAWDSRIRPEKFSFKSKQAIKVESKDIQPIQYWSQGKTPEDVENTTALWNEILKSLGLEPIKLFDKRSARDWIKHQREEFLISFDTAFHYAAEADVFRVAYASSNECIWIDSDFHPTEYAYLTLAQALNNDCSFFFWYPRRSRINNAFFIARRGCKIIKSVALETRGLDLSIYPQNTNTIIATFGAGRYNSIITNLFLNEKNIRLEQKSETPIQKIYFNKDAVQLCDRGFIRSENFLYKYKDTHDYWAKGMFTRITQ